MKKLIFIMLMACSVAMCSNGNKITLVNSEIRGIKLLLPEKAVFKKQQVSAEESLAFESLKEYSFYIAYDEKYNFFVTYNLMAFKTTFPIQNEDVIKIARNSAIYTAERIGAKEISHVVTSNGSIIKYSGVFKSTSSTTVMQYIGYSNADEIKIFGCTSKEEHKAENDKVINSIKF